MVAGKYVDPDGYPLGKWLIKTRQQKLNGNLKEERIAQLDEIGMVWSVFDAKWEKLMRWLRPTMRKTAT